MGSHLSLTTGGRTLVAAAADGLLAGGRAVAPEDAGEDLAEVTTAVGLGLVQLSVDVHCAQWGTLPRLLAARWITGTDGLALDENTRASWRDGTVEVARSGHASLARRAGEAMHVLRYADGDHLQILASAPVPEPGARPGPRRCGMTVAGSRLHEP